MHAYQAGGNAHDHTAGANATMLKWALALFHADQDAASLALLRGQSRLREQSPRHRQRPVKTPLQRDAAND
jgi:hypothetical protein